VVMAWPSHVGPHALIVSWIAGGDTRPLDVT
jgi:hypothetical protein